MTLRRGIITGLKYEDGAVVCNVQDLDRPVEPYQGVSMLTQGKEEIRVPEEGDEVLMAEFQNQLFIIKSITKNINIAPPSMQQNDLLFKFDDNTKIHVSKSNGAFQVNIEAGDDITITSDSNVNIESPNGDVTINGTTFSDHDHDYSWTDNAGSGTTSGPN